MQIQLTDLWQGHQKYTLEKIFSKWCWETWILTCRKVKLDHYLSSFTKFRAPNGLRTSSQVPETARGKYRAQLKLWAQAKTV